MSDTTSSYDVAVVGAGVAGSYVAYRLATAKADDLKDDSPLKALYANGAKPRVGLFDYSGRVGGRLRSVQVDEIPYLAEFGGFRFNQNMHIVACLAKHLGLADEPFYFEEDENPIYVRGARLTTAQLAAGELPPGLYHLAPGEQGLSPDQLSAKVNDAALPGFSELQSQYNDCFNAGDWAMVRALRLEYEQRLATAKPFGRPLSEWPWWALQRQVLSQEAVQLLEDTGGYNGQATSGNAPTSLDESFFFASAPWRHITKGYSAIPDELVRQSGIAPQTHHQLVRFDRSGDGYDLKFFKREAGQTTDWVAAGAACRQDPSGCVKVHAKYLVLALPKRAIELLDPSTPYLQSQAVQEILGSVFGVDAIRFYLAYPSPWWQSAGLTKGRSTTDLGVRQFYYWWTDPDGGESILLASYSNGNAEAYWRNLQGGDEYPGQQPGPRVATQTMVEQAHRQLLEAVGVADAPQPLYAHYQNWRRDPWGGGWHAWQSTNQRDNDYYIVQSRQPVASERVYLVGECWSNVQGWVWGALNSSEAMLQVNLGFKWPQQWLNRGGTWLGPGTDALNRLA